MTSEAGQDMVIRDAATVLVVRDGPGGLEVVMVRRTTSAAFAAGAWVFPGGAVDDDDLAYARRLTTGLGQESAVDIVGSERGLGMWFAAVRESFEESGLLVGVDGPEMPVDLAPLRRAVNAGDRSFASVLDELGGVVDIDSIAYIDRWVTPKGETRRFDTRFFLVEAPPGQEPIHDETETTEAIWARPDEVLERNSSGEIFLLPPTITNLARLARHADAAQAVAAGKAKQGIEPVRPVMKKETDGSVHLRFDSDEIDDIVIRRA